MREKDRGERERERERETGESARDKEAGSTIMSVTQDIRNLANLETKAVWV